MTREERILEWANALTKEQLVELMPDLIYMGMRAEEIHFFQDAAVPYWSHTGEALVEGQVPYPEDDAES